MKTTKFLLGTLLAMSIFISCEKKEDVIDEGIDNDCDGVCEIVSYNTMEAFFEKNGVEEQVFSITAEDGAIITGKKGTIITLPADGFNDANGNLVRGDVDVKIKEIFSASEMILSNRPTNAVNGSGESTFLLSEGETELVVEQNGAALRLVAGKGIRIQVPSSGGEDFEMGAFIGDVDEDDIIVWNQFTNTEIYFQPAPDSYIYDTFSTGWSNCDKFYNYTGDKTTNYVDLTTSPNQDEARVFIVFKENNLPSVVGFTQDYVAGVQSYVNSLPVGLEVTFVGLTINDNQQYMAVETMTITEEANISLSFSAVSTDGITDALALLN